MIPAERTEQAEQRSSVEVSRAANGSTQFKVKVYEGTTVDELRQIREAAVAEYRAMEGTFYESPPVPA